MRDDDVIAIGALALLLLGGKRMTVPWGDKNTWTVPVPDMKVSATGIVYPAVISQEFHDGHYGVDLMYRRRVAGDQPKYATGTHDGNPRFFAPTGAPVVAARDGVLWSADASARGFQVVLDHGKPFATYYQHLASLAVPVAEQGKVAGTGKPYKVQAGDVIGFMGFDPTDPEGLRHLHFAVWFNGAGDAASVDPGNVLPSWRRATWSV